MSKSDPEPKQPYGKLPWIIGGLALLVIAAVVVAIKLIHAAPTAGEAAAAGGGPPSGPPQMPPAAVFVSKIRLEPAQNLAQVTGSLRASARSEIAAQEPGAIAEIHADEGKVVEKNALLVKLDGRRIEAQLGEARAAVKSAGSLVAQREAELKRATEDQVMKKGLFEDRAIAEKDLLDAERALAVAKAQLDSANDSVTEAESRIQLLEIREKDLEIRAPFAGLITERHVEPGEWVAAGEVVMTLVANNPVEAWLRVPERFLTDVQTQPDRIRIDVAEFSEITPEEIRIIPDVDPRSRLFTAVAILDNSKGRLAAGLSTTAQIPVGNLEPHLIIPVNALLRTERGDFVFRATEGEAPTGERIEVRVAFERGGELFLLPSQNQVFKAGDKIVTEGNDRLQPNQQLLIQERIPEQSPPPETNEPKKE